MSTPHHEKNIVTTDRVPKAIGPYSVGVTTGTLVFTAGQLPIDVATGKIVEGGIQAQTRQALINLQAVIEAAGSSLDQVIKTTVFLQIWVNLL